MAPIAVATRPSSVGRATPIQRELLGAKRIVRSNSDVHLSATTITQGRRAEMPPPDVSEAPIASPIKTQPSEIEKVVRKMPTLYVIALFGVVVVCAVSIIWNTLQVNRLTLERTRLEDKITQTEQR